MVVTFRSAPSRGLMNPKNPSGVSWKNPCSASVTSRSPAQSKNPKRNRFIFHPEESLIISFYLLDFFPFLPFFGVEFQIFFLIEITVEISNQLKSDPTEIDQKKIFNYGCEIDKLIRS